MKKMPPPLAPPPLRISSSGGARRPNHNPIALLPPPQPNISTPMISGVNGILERSKAESDVQIPTQSSPLPNGNIPVQPKILNQDGNAASAHTVAPSRPKSQNQHPVIPVSNGYHFPQMNGFQSTVNNPPYLHHTNTTGLNPAQLNQLKNAFAGSDVGAALHPNGRFPSHYVPNGATFNMPQVVGTNVNLKVPGTRPMQWPVPSPPQRSMVGTNLDATRLNGTMSPSPNLAQVVPVRSPSSNGTRPGIRGGVACISPVLGPVPSAQISHSMSPRLHSSPSPLPQGMAQLTSNPSPHHTPSLMSSPSIQQQAVGAQGGC
jgi:enhancer of polycomb-like protein